MKQINISNGKKIFIFDDVFSHQDKINLFLYAKNSNFTTDGTSNELLYEESGRFIVSRYSTEDINNFGIFQKTSEKMKLIFEIIGNKIPIRYWILLSNLSTKIYYHIDGRSNDVPSLSFLYYLNLEWKNDWGGETIFCDDFRDDKICIDYVPGRVVLFDSSISHKAAYVSHDAPLRYTFNCVFEEEQHKI